MDANYDTLNICHNKFVFLYPSLTFDIGLIKYTIEKTILDKIYYKKLFLISTIDKIYYNILDLWIYRNSCTSCSTIVRFIFAGNIGHM